MISKILPINNLNRVKLSEAVPLDTPFSIYVFPTTFCNFKCVYCAHSLGYPEMREQYGFEPQMMSMDIYVKVIGQLKEFPHKLKLLSLTGHGEPMLNPDLPEMVRMARDADVANRIELITNASLMTEKRADAFISAGLDGLRISLQGMSSEKYRDVCGFDLNFNELIRNIRYFYEHKGSCDLFIKIMDVALDEGQEESFYQIFNGISDRMFIESCRPVYSGVEFTEGMRNKITDRYGNLHEPRDVCPLCFFMLSVFPDGDVEPCDTIYKPVVLGNVNTSTLKDMFLGEKLKEFQLMQLRKMRCDNQKCAVCVAPDDVSHPLDVLDKSANEIIDRFANARK